MTTKILRNIDLNLLVVLQAIHELGHLGKVSKKLNLTQSAVSHSLARLRDFYGDPLFVRTKSGMVPTELAKKIAPAVNEALTAVTQTLHYKNQSFDPTSMSREFVLAMGEFFDFIFLTDIHTKLSEEAPNIRLKFERGFGLENIESMKTGNIHLALEWIPIVSSDFIVKPFVEESFYIILNHSHPLVGQSFKRSWFDKFPLICVAPRSHKSAPIQALIEQLDITKEQILKVKSMMSIPQIVAESNHIGLVTRSVAMKASKYFPINKIELEEGLPKACGNLIWHRSMNNDEGHKWLRRLIIEHYSNIG